MTGAESEKKRRDAARAKGLRYRCKKKPAEKPGGRCQECITKAKGLYQRRKETGICIRCGKRPATRGYHCEGCADSKILYEENRQEILRLQHRCRRCAEKMPADWWYTLCPKHMEETNCERRERYHRQKK